MNFRIGYWGTVDNKFKIFFDGDNFTAEYNGMRYAIDYEAIPESRKQRL